MGRRAALLVGINQYPPESGIKALNYAEDDVRLLAGTLKEECGFDTKLLLGESARRDPVLLTLAGYDSLQDLDLFIFFFSGHGESDDRNIHYLHCHDSRPPDVLGTLPVSDLMKRIGAVVPAKKSVLILDACRDKSQPDVEVRAAYGHVPSLSPALLSQMRQIAVEAKGVKVRSRPGQPEIRFLYSLASCGPLQIAYEDHRLKQGLFSHFFTQEIASGARKDSLRGICAAATQKMRDWCIEKGLRPPQIPHWIAAPAADEVYLTDHVPTVKPAKTEGVEHNGVSMGDGSLPPLYDLRVLVSALSAGEFDSVGRALAAAPAETTIVVRPGLYGESVTINKAVAIIADGKSVILESDEEPCIRVVSGKVHVQNLNIRRSVGVRTRGGPAVEVTCGELLLDNCRIDSAGIAVDAVGPSAMVTLVHCTVRSPRGSGVEFRRGARGSVEGCTITNPEEAGIRVRGGIAAVAETHIMYGRSCGLVVSDGGRVTLRDAVVLGCHLSGVVVSKGASLEMAGTSIVGCHESGVLVAEEGRATLDRCLIEANKMSGIEVRQNGQVIAHRCPIRKNDHYGVREYEGGRTVLDGCEITENARGSRSQV